MGAEIVEALATRAKRALSEAGNNALEAANNAKITAGEAAGALSETAGDAAGAIAAGAGIAADVVSSGAEIAAKAVVGTAENAADAVSSTASQFLKAIKDHSRESSNKKAKVASFRDGLNEGAYLMAKKAYAHPIAVVALMMYVARCDGNVAKEEIARLMLSLKHVCIDENVPEAIKMELNEIACNDALTFDDVASYLDKLSVTALEALRVDLDEAIEADGRVSPEEIEACARFDEYVKARRDAEVDINA